MGLVRRYALPLSAAAAVVVLLQLVLAFNLRHAARHAHTARRKQRQLDVELRRADELEMSRSPQVHAAAV